MFHYGKDIEVWKRRFMSRGLGKILPRDVSPLRFPGGKASLKYFLADVVCDNNLQDKTLVEPFCGGCGATLPLLIGKVVSVLRINDANPAIAAFWHAVFYDTDNFLQLLYETPVDLETWMAFKTDLKNPQALSKLELGFRAFYLNRTNRSGLINGGPIGGRSQSGKYKINCRFNKVDLISRIERLSSFRGQVEVSNTDAIDLLQQLGARKLRNALVFLDPPYVRQGYNIYRKYCFREEDHRRLANYLKQKKWRWLLTYDDCELIHSLYSERKHGVLEYSYYMQTAKIGRELILASSVCRIPHPPSENMSQDLTTFKMGSSSN